MKEDIRLLSRQEIDSRMEMEVFSTEDFRNHVKEVSENLNIDQEIVRDVLIHYFKSITVIVNTVRKTLTKINIHGFLSIEIEKGRKF